MSSRIYNIWRKCKHNELVASVNTSVISRIQHVYRTENNPTKPIISVIYPIYNTHVTDNEWDLVCIDIIRSLNEMIPGIEVKDIHVSQGQPSYNCITVKIKVPEDYWEDSSNERV